MSDEGGEGARRPEVKPAPRTRRSASLSVPPALPKGVDLPLVTRLRYSPAALIAFLDRSAVNSANYVEGLVWDQHMARRGRGTVKRDRLAIFKLIGALAVFVVASALLSIIMLGLRFRIRSPRRQEVVRGRK